MGGSYRRGLLLATLVAGLVGSACGGTGTTGQTERQWERIDPDPSVTTGPVAIVAWGARLVGVGGPGLAWASADGRTWTTHPLAGAEAGADDPTGAADLVVVDDRVLAIGSASGRAVVLASPDGVTWTRAPDDPDMDPEAGYAQLGLEDIAAGPRGLVVTATEWGPAGQRPVAFHSLDGREWVRSATPLEGSGPRDVLATPDGFVLAGAGNARPGEPTRAAFWFSPDGLTWTAAPDDVSFASAEPAALASHGGTILAVGVRFGQAGTTPAAWTSSDGRTWVAVPDSPAFASWPFTGPTPVADQGAIQGSAIWGACDAWDGFLAAGTSWGLDPSAPLTDGGYGMAFRGGLWRSLDGTAWERLPDDLLTVGPDNEAGGTLAYGLMTVMPFDGRPLVIGDAPDTGLTLWLGPAAFD